MKLQSIINRASRPAPWAEGDNIPWDDPEFSKRMLKEHLSQAHDAASRRTELIGRHVDWIHNHVLLKKPARILDIACGPGLYTHRLAQLGHECVGIDFAPASIDYATKRAHEDHLACTYLHEDVRSADFGSGFNMAMLIFGQLNVFQPEEAEGILKKASHALTEDGALVLEPQRIDSIRKRGESLPTWSSTPAGLFSDEPYLCLEERHWDAESKTATERFFVVDADTASVTRHALTNQAYTEDDFRNLLTQCGFAHVDFYPSLEGTDAKDEHLFAILAKKARS